MLKKLLCSLLVLFLMSAEQLAFALGPRMDASAFAEMAIRADNHDWFNQVNLNKDFELVGTVIMKDWDRIALFLNNDQVCAYGVVVVMSNRNTSNINIGQIVTVDCVYRGFLVEPATPIIPLPCISYMFEGIGIIQ